MENKKFKVQYLLPFLVGGLFLLFFVMAFFRFGQKRELLIAEQLKELTSIFKKINNDTNIISIEPYPNYINFLNVKSFAGSEVGPLNLKYPENWKGPYLFDNPTIQEKYYRIIKTFDGFYIVPGQGVQIKDKIIGKDIILDENSNIQELIDNETLTYKGEALAAKLKL